MNLDAIKNDLESYAADLARRFAERVEVSVVLGARNGTPLGLGTSPPHDPSAPVTTDFLWFVNIAGEQGQGATYDAALEEAARRYRDAFVAKKRSAQ